MIQPTSASSGMVAEPETVTASCSGTIIRSVKWISPYPAPSQVLVKVAGFARFANSNNDHFGTASNWIGSDLEATDWAGFDMATESVEYAAYVYLSLDSSGVAMIEADQQAFISVTGPGVSAHATAEYFDITLAETAAGITPWQWPTFRKDWTTGLPVANPVVYITPRVLDTAVVYHEAGTPHWDLDATFTRLLMGPWTDPYTQWWANSDYWADSLFTEYVSIETQYTWPLTATFPREEAVVLSVENNGPPYGTRVGDLLMRVHLPAENVAVVSDQRVLGPWIRVSPLFIVHPWDEPKVLAEDVTWSHSYTSEMSTTLGSSLGAELVIKAQLNSSMTSALGQTAEISITHHVEYTFAPDSVAKVWWVERQAFYRYAEGNFDYFATNGFQGVEGFGVSYFESGSAAAAEQLDYYEQSNWEYY
jgi:hypothetical protein